MSICMFLKVFGDLCLCYSVVSALPALFAHEMSFLWVALICGLGGGVAGLLSEQGKGRFRFWALLLPASTLLLAGSLIEVLMLIPAIAYSAVLICREHMVLEYYDFRAFYLRALALWALFLAVVGMLFGFESESHQSTMTFDFMGTLSYGLLYALSGVLLLRQLRLGVDTRSGARAMNGIQLVLLLSGTVVLVAVIVTVEQIYHEDLLALLMMVIPVLLSAPFVFLGAVLEVLIRLFAMLPNYRRYEETVQEGSGAWADTVISTEETTLEELQAAQEAAFPWWLAVLVLALLVVLLLYMLKILRAHSEGQGSAGTMGTVTPQRREKKAVNRSNRGKVRKAYRTYLKAEKNSGLKLKTNQTSEDILRLVTSDTDPDAAARLRQVYLAARYDESRDITPDQVKAAKDALRLSRK